MVEKEMREVFHISIIGMQKANNKYMKEYNPKEESHIYYLESNNLMEAMSQLLPIVIKWFDKEILDELTTYDKIANF